MNVADTNQMINSANLFSNLDGALTVHDHCGQVHADTVSLEPVDNVGVSETKSVMGSKTFTY